MTAEHRRHEFCPVPPPQNEMVQLGSVLPLSASDPYSHLDIYPLRVGDQIQFTLSVDPNAQPGAYRIEVNDEITVEYLHDPEDKLPRRMRVLPNGTIDLPMLGTVEVAGKTVDQVRRDVNRLATRFYKHPQIAVTVTQHAGRAEELRRAFSSGFTNQSLTVVVSPEGEINLPEIGTVRAFGLTIAQLRDEVNRRYAEKVAGVQVWPHLVERAPDQVFVLGQVQKPGRYLLDRPTHASQALAQAGGWLLGAELREVVLIRYREGDPQAIVLDLHHAVRRDRRPRDVDLTDDLLLADGDIVMVPRDTEQNFVDYIQRVIVGGVYGVIPLPRATVD